MAVRVTDNFNRADANPAGNPWTGAFNGVQVKTNTMRRGQSSGGDGFGFYNNDTPPKDHYAKLAFSATGNTAGSDNDDAGPMVRMNSNPDGYLFNVEPNDKSPGPGSNWVLFSVSGGSGTSLANGSTSTTLVAGDIAECRAVGNTISGWINGVQITSTTDSTFPNNQGYGTHNFDNAATAVGAWDNFEGGDFTGSTLPCVLITDQGKGVLLKNP